MDASGQYTDPRSETIACLIRIQQVMLAKGYIYIAGDRDAWPDTPVQMDKEESKILITPYHVGTSEQVLEAWDQDEESTGLLLVGQVDVNAPEIDDLLAHKRPKGRKLAYIDAAKGQFRTPMNSWSLLTNGREALLPQNIRTFLDATKYRSSADIDCPVKLVEHIAQEHQRELFKEAMQEAAGTKWPVFTLIAIAVMTVMSVMMFYVVGWDPWYSTSDESLIGFGTLYSPLVRDGQQWRMLSYSILHGNSVHFLFSIIVIATSGWWLEMHQGKWRALISFAAGAFGGAIASLWMAPEAIVVSSAGGMFGMFGAIIAVELRFLRQFPKGHLKATSGMLLYILLYGIPAVILSNVGFVTGIALASGGLIGGLTYGFVVARSPANVRWPRRWVWWALLGLVLLSLALADHAISRIPQDKDPPPDDTMVSVTRE